MKPIRFGKYQLLERISHGGMAEVFRAKTFGAAGFERTVAIKLLLPTVAMDHDFITMLVDEAKIAGQLNHANIAQIFDLGMADGRYYIVQEFVNGKDLRAICREMSQRDELMSVAQCCHVLLKMCEGLEYAHNKRDAAGRALNLVHRDVSPQNVVVSREGEVKLIDFGIAKAEGRATRTLAGLVKGKFAYMSPEQIRGLPVDRRSDVFACGIVLHEMLTGKPLFRRKSEFETLKRARSAEIEPPSQTNPAVPPELDRVVLRALARHVEDRHQTALEFRDDLWEFVRLANQHYTRNELAGWMRETFPKDAAVANDAEYDIRVEPDGNATVVDAPGRRDDGPTIDYRQARAPAADAAAAGDTDESRWGSLDDLAKGPNPDHIEYAADMAPRFGRSRELVGAMTPDLSQLEPTVELEATTSQRRRAPPPFPPGPAPSGNGHRSGAPDPAASAGGTLRFPKAHGSSPPIQRRSTPAPPVSLVRGPMSSPAIEQTIDTPDAPPQTESAQARSSHRGAILLAALLVLLVAGATSITLAVRDSGKSVPADSTK